MAAVMTKRGTQDNVATYEHVCDTTADMAAINPQYINLGSICLVINGESGGLEVYIADSNKKWSAISVAAGGGGGGESGGLSIHICSANEYDSTTKTPTITAPAADTIYLVPTGSTTGDLFSEWIYVDSAWERIGGTSIDLSQYATKTDLTNYVAKSEYDPTDRYIELFYDTDTNTYSWASDTAQHFATLSDICQSTIDFDKRPSVYAVMSAEDDYDTETESGLYNHGRIFPLIFAHSKQGSKVSDGSEVIENQAIFGSTYTNDNGQLVFESFTITNHTLPSDYPQDDVVTHSITPIASFAGSFAAAEELSDVVTNLKSLVQEIAYTTSSSHAAATITSIDTLLTALDAMKPQPTYTPNVIYENFTNNATRFSTDNIPINFANGDYVEALIDVTTCSQDQENILSVGTSIDSFDAAVAYLFYWRNNKIHVRLKDVEASIAVDRYVEANDYSAVLIRIDSTGVYIDGTLVPGMTGDNVTHINSAGTYKIGCRMSKLNTATYDHITVYNKNQEGLYVKIYNYSGEEITLEGSGDLTSRDYYCAFSLFETIGVVGDSYANGYCGEDPTATAGINHPNLSWPQVLARRHGVDVKNYAWGGMSTATFITNTSYGLPVLTADAPRCLYILALERNDYNRENNGEAGYIGSITDITSHSRGSYPDTFYGNYATIIETIQNHAPKARIVMMSGDYSESNALGHAYNLAVIEIAEHYGLPCMVQREDIYFQGDNAYYREKPAGGHPSVVAYTGMEMAIERLFNKCVKDNIAYFEYYTGVPTT